MTPLVDSVTKGLSLLVITSDAAALLILFALLARRFGKVNPITNRIIKFFGAHAFILAFSIASGSLLSSLFYSEVAGFAPCLLCWWQRIFFYPQVVLFAVAFLKKDGEIEDYIIALSAIGGIIAAYHSYLQFGGSPLVPCSASAVAASCAQRYFLEFGYITIPTMALTGFTLIPLLMLAKKANKLNYD